MDAPLKSLKALRLACGIFAKYLPEGELTEDAFYADSEVLLCECSGEQLPEESPDGRRLRKLGWCVDEERERWVYYT